MHTLQKVLHNVELGVAFPGIGVCVSPTFLDVAKLFLILVWQLTLSLVVYVRQDCSISSPDTGVIRLLSFCNSILDYILKLCHVVLIFIALHFLDYSDSWRDQPSFHTFTSSLVLLLCIIAALPFILLLLCAPEQVFS